jgi:hypothetical protein
MIQACKCSTLSQCRVHRDKLECTGRLAMLSFLLLGSTLSSYNQIQTQKAYVQVRTDAHEYFAEVKAEQGLLARLWPWKRTGRWRTTPWNSEDHQLTPTQRAAESLCNFGIVLGSFTSGALGGMAIMTLMQIHLFNINNQVIDNDLVLVYYAPIALTVNRIYWGLIMIALASAVSRCGTSALPGHFGTGRNVDNS